MELDAFGLSPNLEPFRCLVDDLHRYEYVRMDARSALQLVNFPTSWTEALRQAALRTNLGFDGHLATITTASELDCVLREPFVAGNPVRTD